MGMYSLRSEETSGITKKEEEGMNSTWNRVGVAASLCVGGLLLARRSVLTACTRCMACGMARSAPGGQSPSHRHQRS